ncbi:MAG: pentapeptide repeat-containing protein [Parvularculaceae bacterium]|nr:pentapeptide repeat-containing protein [Parvularculaceae bacterium]
MAEKSAEQLEKEWWERWRTQDWSWEGLADKSWNNGKTLQDFWSDQRQHLRMGADGKKYLTAHYPWDWPDGVQWDANTEPKKMWRTEQHLELRRWLEDFWQERRSDARFDGVVLLRVPQPPSSLGEKGACDSVVFNSSWLKPGGDWDGKSFGSASFMYSNFVGGCSFDNSDFSSAWFNGAHLLGYSNFHKAEFAQNASLHSAKFTATANFQGARFAEGINLQHARFSGGLYFNGTRFDKPSFRSNRLCLEDMTCSQDLSFHPSDLPTDFDFSASAFEGTVVSRNFYFNASKMKLYSVFDGLVVNGLIRLKGEDALNSTTLDGIINSTHHTLDTDSKKDRHLLQARLKALSGGARVLANGMEKARNHGAAQWFHRLEQSTRLFQTGQGQIRTFLTRIYAATSNFGYSLGRPLVSLLTSWLGLTSILWVLALSAPEERPIYETSHKWSVHHSIGDAGSALRFAAANSLRPGHVFSLRRTSASVFERRLFFGEGARGGFIAMVAISSCAVQSIFSILMLFLTGLAARRYYQMS